MFTQEDVNKAVADATAALKTELDELRKFKAAADSEDAAKAFQEQVESAKAEVAELQQKLDAATIEANDSKTKHEELLAWLEEEAVKAEREVELARLRDERAEAVRQLDVFPAEYIEQNAERFAAMEAEVFEAAVADWKAAAVATRGEKKDKGEELPPATSFTATRKEEVSGSALKAVLDLRRQGIDPRRVHI